MHPRVTSDITPIIYERADYYFRLLNDAEAYALTLSSEYETIIHSDPIAYLSQHFQTSQNNLSQLCIAFADAFRGRKNLIRSPQAEDLANVINSINECFYKIITHIFEADGYINNDHCADHAEHTKIYRFYREMGLPCVQSNGNLPQETEFDSMPYGDITTLLVDWDDTLCHKSNNLDHQAIELLKIAKTLQMKVRIFTARSEYLESRDTYPEVVTDRRGKRSIHENPRFGRAKITDVIKRNHLEDLITPDMIDYCSLTPYILINGERGYDPNERNTTKTKRECYTKIKTTHSLNPQNIAVLDDNAKVISDLEDPGVPLNKFIVGKRKGNTDTLVSHLETILTDVVLASKNFDKTLLQKSMESLMCYFKKYYPANVASNEKYQRINAKYAKLSERSQFFKCGRGCGHSRSAQRDERDLSPVRKAGSLSS